MARGARVIVTTKLDRRREGGDPHERWSEILRLMNERKKEGGELDSKI